MLARKAPPPRDFKAAILQKAQETGEIDMAVRQRARAVVDSATAASCMPDP